MSFFESSSSLNNNSLSDDDFFGTSERHSQDFFSSIDQSRFFNNTQNRFQSQFFQSTYLSTSNQDNLSYFENSNTDRTKKQSQNLSPNLFSDSNSDDLFTDSQVESSIELSLSTQNSKKDQSVSIEKSCLNQSSALPCEIDFCMLPASIVKLYKEIRDNFSDWTFTSVITGQLCSDTFPMSAYNHLKLPLLMSIVGSQENKLHIMAVGQEISHASMIMNRIGKFAQRFLRATSLDGIIVNNNNVVEAGSIMLSTNGISYLGNWQKFPQKSALKLLREIETKIMLVDKIQKNFPLETTIWSYWSFTSKIKKDLASINQFINVFGIPIVIDDDILGEEIIDDLLNQQLVEPFDRSHDYEIPENDFQTYLNFAKNLSVDFGPSAEKILKNYFMATRIIRPDVLSERAYESLKIMAESHAKLCLRKIVNRLDALVAISIAEKFIKEFFENDAFTSPSLQLLSIDCYDKYMSELFEWYSKFTSDILEK